MSACQFWSPVRFRAQETGGRPQVPYRATGPGCAFSYRAAPYEYRTLVRVHFLIYWYEYGTLKVRKHTDTTTIMNESSLLFTRTRTRLGTPYGAFHKQQGTTVLDHIFLGGTILHKKGPGFGRFDQYPICSSKSCTRTRTKDYSTRTRKQFLERVLERAVC